MISRPLRTTKGENTSAAWGVANFLLRLREKYTPDYVGWINDAGTSFREERYPDYKSTREKLDEELQADFDRSLERIIELLAAFRVPLLTVPGYEADDVIATLATQAADAEPPGGDRLGRQGLLSAHRPRDRAAQPRPRRAGRRRGDLGGREQRLRAARRRALAGGGLPGARGRHERQHSRRQRRRREGRPEAPRRLRRSRHHPRAGSRGHRQAHPRGAARGRRQRAALARAGDHQAGCAGGARSRRACGSNEPDFASLRRILTELEFFTLARKLRGAGRARGRRDAGRGTATPAPEAPVAEQSRATPALPTIQVRCRSTIPPICPRWSSGSAPPPSWRIDAETSSLEPRAAEIVGLSLAAGPNEAWYVPFSHRHHDGGELALATARLAPRSGTFPRSRPRTPRRSGSCSRTRASRRQATTSSATGSFCARRASSFAASPTTRCSRASSSIPSRRSHDHRHAVARAPRPADAHLPGRDRAGQGRDPVRRGERRRGVDLLRREQRHSPRAARLLRLLARGIESRAAAARHRAAAGRGAGRDGVGGDRHRSGGLRPARRGAGERHAKAGGTDHRGGR